MKAKACPGCTFAESPAYSYTEWLQSAYHGIERGLNANAIWRLHERHAKQHHELGAYDLGGEA